MLSHGKPCMGKFGDAISVVVVSGPCGEEYRIEATLETESGVRRTWTVKRTDIEFESLNDVLLAEMGLGVLPPLPTSRADALHVYLRGLLENPRVMSNPAIYEFLEAPPDSVTEPVLKAEVVSGDVSQKRFRSADPLSHRAGPKSESSPGGAAVAGAVLGGLLAGPLGAVLGGVAGSRAVGRDDSIGDVVKTAGAAADVAIDAARKLEREYDVSGKAGKAARTAKNAVQRVDQEYQVRKRAGETAKNAVKAVRKMDEDFRVREKAQNAFRSVSTAIKRSAEELAEEMRKEDQ
ncbi:unnamed protein product [Discosporangium mesarthrocarpum]